MHVNIREELWYIELLNVFEQKNRNCWEKGMVRAKG